MARTKPRSVVVLGSTGTIGRHALDVIARLPDRLVAVGLAAGRNVALLAEQAAHVRPARVAIGDAGRVDDFKKLVAGCWEGEILPGAKGLEDLAGSGAGIVVNGLVGAAGLGASLSALGAGSDLALANKESLVIAGPLLMNASARAGGRILPIDSEHSGLLQCLDAGGGAQPARVVLTASGGPFREWPPDRIDSATPEEALRHPTWKMGPRITIDSATLLNKGFEMIEARWLFDIPVERIDVWIHPQSLVHAIAEWADGSMIAQLSVPDMRLPIQYALCYPERPASGLPRCDLTGVDPLRFEAVDPARYPCLGLARLALEMGGSTPAVLNAADEILVESFLDRRIRFGQIAELLARIVRDHRPIDLGDLGDVLCVDAETRRRARALVEGG